jgi:hypothetical protein
MDCPPFSSDQIKSNFCGTVMAAGAKGYIDYPFAENASAEARTSDYYE